MHRSVAIVILIWLCCPGCSPESGNEDLTEPVAGVIESGAKLELLVATCGVPSSLQTIPLAEFTTVESEFEKLDWISENRNCSITIARRNLSPVVFEQMTIFPARFS